MASTLTNYSNNINTLYPVAGQDNDTQGFRNNFSYIQKSFSAAAGEISSLQQNTPKLNAAVSDFNNNKIYRASLVGGGNYSPTMYSISTNTELSYLQGNYQRIAIANTLTISIVDWPPTTIQGKIALELSNAGNTGSYTVNFAASYSGQLVKEPNLNLPINIPASTSTYQIVELWSTDAGETVFVKAIGSMGALADNIYYVTSSSFATTATNATTATYALTAGVANGISTLTNLKIGTANIASTANNLVVSGTSGIKTLSTQTIEKTYIGGTVGASLNLTSLTLNNAYEIKPGDVFRIFPTETATHVISTINTITGVITFPAFSSNEANSRGVTTNSPINIFREMNYSNMLYATDVPSSPMGRPGDRAGTVAATSSSVYMCYADYVNTTTQIWTKLTAAWW